MDKNGAGDSGKNLPFQVSEENAVPTKLPIRSSLKLENFDSVSKKTTYSNTTVTTEDSGTQPKSLAQGEDDKDVSLFKRWPNLYLFVLVFITVMSSFLFGYHASMLNPPQLIISKCLSSNNDVRQQKSANEPIVVTYDSLNLPRCIPIDDGIWGLLSATYPVGGLFGSYFGSPLLDKYGRRNSIKITTIGTALGSLLMILAINVWMLGIGRLIVGTCMGWSSLVIAIYVVEISPKKWRGTLGSLPQLSLVTGILVNALFGMILSTLDGWRIFFTLSLIPVLIQVAGFSLMVESPNALILRGLVDEARATLQKLRGRKDVEEELKLLVSSADSTVGSNTTISDNSKLKKSGNIQVKKKRMSILMLFRDKSLRKSLLLSGMLQFMQQLVGINAIIYYSTSIFASVLPEYAGTLNLILAIVNILSTIVGVFLMDLMGRRPLLLASLSGTFISALLFVLGSVLRIDILKIVSVYLYVGSFAFGLGPIPWLMMAEIFPGYAASAGASLGCAVNWGFTMVVSGTFPVLQSALGDYVFIPYMTNALLSLLYSIKYVPETKGKTIDEILLIINGAKVDDKREIID